MVRRAIINVSDTGALESTAHMLESVGYECSRPDDTLIMALSNAKLANVLSVRDLIERWGYAEPRVTRLSSLADMKTADLFVDTKAHVNYPKIISRWPNLEGKVLWCCLNGGDPRKRTDGEPWANPPCPVLTNNQWYSKESLFLTAEHVKTEGSTATMKPIMPWRKAYACYPPYMRAVERSRTGMDGPPLCLCHNVERWGYGAIIPALSALGVQFYGTNSPQGLLPHAEAMQRLSRALCHVYAKVGDTVGYAVVETLTSKVPLVCTQFYIDETRQHDLLMPGFSCLLFDHDEPESLVDRLNYLRDPVRNEVSGDNGYRAYKRVEWKDVDGFREFMRRNYD